MMPRTMQRVARVVTVSLLAGVLGACASPGAKERAENGYDIYAKLDRAPGNITVTPDGRVLVSLHQFYEPRWRVAEVSPKTGILRPFPSGEWAEELGADGIGLDAVLGIRTSADGIVWMLDNGLRLGSTPRLIGWDLETDSLHRVIAIPNPPGGQSTFLNDLAVDPVEDFIYIADTGGERDPALVVVDLTTGLSRRVLEGDPVVLPESGVEMVIGDRVITRADENGVQRPARIGVNPIAIDAKGEWVYFGAMSGKTLYRVRASDLRDRALSSPALSARVERYATKPVCDGITIDTKDNIYITDLEAGGIGVIGRDRQYELLFSDPAVVSWPDAIGGGPDGLLYIPVNQLQNSPALNGGVDASLRPYLIIRVEPRAKPVVGY
jgi:sugar lactone lactonase YvrE